MCPDCKHALRTKDLIPVFSWLWQGGKCRYCKKSISWQYPAVELSTALIFVGSYLFWPKELDSGWLVTEFSLWLIVLTGLIALVIYDLRWMLLPNRIIFPLYGLAAVMVGARSLEQMSISPTLSAIGGVVIGGGIFYALFQISHGRWIGGGDVKLGFLLGAIVGSPQLALLLLFLASILGTVYAACLMSLKGIKRSAKVPFGPFLIFATVITLFYGQAIIDWYLEISLITTDY